MATATVSPFGIGVYTVPEAARLTEVSAERLHRWLRGYAFMSSGEQRESPALWTREISATAEDEGRLFLSFRDLIEARWVAFFLDQGSTWSMVRDSATRLVRELGTTHPFATGQFAAVVTGDSDRPRARIAALLPAGKMRDVVSDQMLLGQFMAPFVRQLVYEKRGARREPVRWFPLAGSKKVLVDPAVRFGRPIVKSGVPTEILWRNHRKGGATYREISHWWRVPEAEVKAAVQWEDQLRRAA